MIYIYFYGVFLILALTMFGLKVHFVFTTKEKYKIDKEMLVRIFCATSTPYDEQNSYVENMNFLTFVGAMGVLTCMLIDEKFSFLQIVIYFSIYFLLIFSSHLCVYIFDRYLNRFYHKEDNLKTFLLYNNFNHFSFFGGKDYVRILDIEFLKKNKKHYINKKEVEYHYFVLFLNLLRKEVVKMSPYKEFVYDLNEIIEIIKENSFEELEASSSVLQDKTKKDKFDKVKLFFLEHNVDLEDFRKANTKITF